VCMYVAVPEGGEQSVVRPRTVPYGLT